MNFKNAAVLMLMGLSTVACSMPEQRTAYVVDFRDPAVPYYAEKCKQGTTTGHGIGYQNCIDENLQSVAIAQASGRSPDYEAVFEATLRE